MGGKDILFNVCGALKEWTKETLENHCDNPDINMAESGSGDSGMKQQYHKWWSSDQHVLKNG